MTRKKPSSSGPKRKNSGPSPRKTYHHGDLPRALREAALKLIARDGVEAFTLREVARVVGVNHTAVYRHFEDKQALLAAVAEEGYRALEAALQQAVEGAGADRLLRLRAFGRAYVGFAAERPSHFGVMFGPRVNMEGRFPTLEQAAQAAFSVVLCEIEEGLATGALRGARAMDLALALWTMAHGFTELYARGRIRVRTIGAAQQMLVDLMEPLLQGVAVSAGGSGGPP